MGRSVCGRHKLSEDEVDELRASLLGWYDTSARDLPWRSAAKPGHKEYIEDPDVRGYSTLVSEIMLQQTQVNTVKAYYKKWMSKWPTLLSLSSASLDSVNQAWSGLGYYSRARRLQEAASLITTSHGGHMPRTAPDLLKLPGVGKYTAGAVASIAYNEVAGLVDGNVVRVLTRLRTIGAESTSNQVTEAVWGLAEQVVDTVRPGDFNQALMELGATVCTPKSPSCDSCPLQNLCGARQEGQGVRDIEDCGLCMSDKEDWDPSLGVTNYPRKAKKSVSKSQVTLVAVVSRNKAEEQFALVQRPKTGLLANLLEFPSLTLKQEEEEVKMNRQVDLLSQVLLDKDMSVSGLRLVGEVGHVFSHINMKYVVYRGEGGSSKKRDSGLDKEGEVRWLTREQFEKCGTSTAMRKVFKSLTDTSGTGGKKRKLQETGNQRNIKTFFDVAVKQETNAKKKCLPSMPTL